MRRRAMKIAVEGCCHGELNKIYQELGRLEHKEGTKVDLLIICGDFQAVRNSEDLKCLACPPKYRTMGDFHLYHSGKLSAPVPTLFIGGNHEASNHMMELYHGGWVCPNIYYLGASGVVQFGGLRIGGISGIFNEHHYDIGYYERPPFQGPALRSAYHYRRLETLKLSQLKEGKLDVFLSHEWPTGIYHYGDKERLLKIKPYFRNEVSNNSLGAKPLEELLFKLKPKNWFSAHMHVHFEATVPHPSSDNYSESCSTQFLALDKCLPRRTFLQILDIEPATDGPKEFRYDPEWLGIVKAADSYMNMRRSTTWLPETINFKPFDLPEELKPIPRKFVSSVGKRTNPFTDAFCSLLGIANRMDFSKYSHLVETPSVTADLETNPDEIQLDEELPKKVKVENENPDEIKLE